MILSYKCIIYCNSRSALPDDEVILGTATLDSNGVLCMRPDFNRGRKPYVVETSSFGKGKSSFECSWRGVLDTTLCDKLCQ